MLIFLGRFGSINSCAAPLAGAILCGCTNESPGRVGTGDRIPPAAEGPEARRPARPRRTPPRGLLPLLPRGPAGREGVGLGAPNAGRPVPGPSPLGPVRPAPVDPRRDHRAPVEEEGPCDLQLGPDQLFGL